MNSENNQFMLQHHTMGDLAPRDIVSRAVMSELKNGPVYLDTRHLDKDFLIKRFPTIYQKLLNFGLKMEKDLIPVTPAAHFHCGGVKVDLNGQTNIEGLYAFGEVARTGVHGANRLASNSLLEAMVWSSSAAKNAIAKQRKTSSAEDSESENNIDEINTAELLEINSIRELLRQSMWKNVGIIRSKESLLNAESTVIDLQKKFDILNKDLQITSLNLEILELKNMLLIAKLIFQSALERKESRGCHYRSDYPRKDDQNWQKSIETVIN